MPSRGKYAITSREEGKAAQRDESYKSCVFAMLIFIVLCVVLILASSPWKTFQTRYSRDHQRGEEDSMNSARMNGHGFTTAGTERSVVTETRQTARSEVSSKRYFNYEPTETHVTRKVEETGQKFDGTSRKIDATTQNVETSVKIEATTRKVGATSPIIEGMTQKIGVTSTMIGRTIRKVGATSPMIEGHTQKVGATSPMIEETTRKVGATSPMIEGTIRKLGVTSTMTEGTTRKVGATSPMTEGTTRKVEEKSPMIEGTTRKVGVTSAMIEEMTRNVEATSPITERTTRKVGATSPIIEGTTRKVGVTSAMIEETTRNVEATSPITERTTRKVGAMSPIIERTTRKVETTSPMIEEMTRKVGVTSAMIEETTRNVEATSPITERTTRKVGATSPIIEETTRKVETTSPMIEELTRKVGATSSRIEETTRKVEETYQSIENVEQRISTTLATLFSPKTTPTIQTPEVSTSSVDKEMPETAFRNATPSTNTFATSTKTYELINGNSSAGESEEIVATIENSTTSPETTKHSTDDYTSLRKLVVERYFGNESSTTSSKTENWLDEMEGTKKEPAKLSSSSTRIVPSSTVQIHSTTEPVTTTREIDQSNDGSEEAAPKAISETNVDECETGSCKQLASKMLSYMNHSSKECDDFYEYACGGLQADGQINEKNLLHNVYERIEIQARKQKSSLGLQLLDYYESCLKYETSFDTDRRIDMAKDSLEKIGKFYTSENPPGEFRSFTTLFANMLSQNRPVLFDIVPEVNERNPDAFTLRIGPAVDDNPFRTMYPADPCEEANLENLEEQVDLDRLYQSYRKCRKDSKVTVIALTQDLKALGIFGELENTSNETHYLEDTVTNIYRQMIEGIQTYFPTDSEIREAYRSKDYTVTTLGELQSTCTLVNWTQLVQSLTGSTPGPDTELQVYYIDELTRAMKRLEIFSRRKELALNNVLLGLYARNLYRDLVAPRSTRDLEKKCFNVAAHFMQTEASALYLSSFSASEIENMRALIQSAFHELRETLRHGLKVSEWATGLGREVLLKKIDHMKMSIPQMSRANKGHGSRLNITDNYFENSMSLMKKYRSMMYRLLEKNPKDPEQIWTFFASPYQSIPRTIYVLNLIVVPFGAIDWPLLSGSMENLDCASLATVGNLVAREIAHNFDTNGIRYWKGSRLSQFAPMTGNDFTRSNFEYYINCQRDMIYAEPVIMSLPATGQQLTFRIPSLGLNERLSDAVGMRLAHDTLVRLGTDASEKQLPWLGLNGTQLYYLIYSQTHCTKASLVSSYVRLHEDPTLPSRARIFVAASNNENLGKSWDCPDGSPLLPSFTCGVFPHLQNQAAIFMPDAA